MTLDKIHSLSRLIMWISVGMAVIIVFLILPGYPILGIVLFGLAILSTIVSAIFKKKYCPRCRNDDSCMK